jgi:hypothetical protein
MTMGKQENVTLTEPTSSHVNKLPAAHRPDAMAGGTGENAAHTHLPVLGDLPRVQCTRCWAILASFNLLALVYTTSP